MQILKFVPFLAGPVGAGQQLAKMQEKHPEFEAEPLAYLAFASARFVPRARYAEDAAAEADAELDEEW